MHASTGYAAYLLTRSGCPDAGRQALKRLSTATATLPAARTRAVVFGRIRLAVLHMTHPDGDPTFGAVTARQVVDQLANVRSARLARDLRTLRLAAAQNEDGLEIRQVSGDLDRVLDRLG